jgi:hypothetical protein
MPATASRPRKMQLTKGQSAPLWGLRGAAWAQHCADLGTDPRDKAALETWWRALLWATLQVRSLTEVPRSGAAYVDLMAALEVSARNGIAWQLRRPGAEVRPLVHAVLDFVEERQLSEHYVCGIARQMLCTEEMPALDRLTPAQLLTLLQILRSKGGHREAPANGALNDSERA